MRTEMHGQAVNTSADRPCRHSSVSTRARARLGRTAVCTVLHAGALSPVYVACPHRQACMESETMNKTTEDRPATALTADVALSAAEHLPGVIRTVRTSDGGIVFVERSRGVAEDSDLNRVGLSVTGISARVDYMRYDVEVFD